MGTIKENLIQKFRDRSARVGVVGIGYVGLPLAVVFAEAGFTVVGVDPDVEKVETINRRAIFSTQARTRQSAG